MDPNTNSTQTTPPASSPNQTGSGRNKWQEWKTRLATKQGLGLLAAVVVVLAGLAIYVANKQENRPVTPPATQHAPAQAAVSITDSGYVPATISIKSGTQLTWTNHGQKSHQVAADPYPLNNSIQGFDNTKTLLPGDSLAFTFETSGTYHLHDQLDPLDKRFGLTVIVQ